MTSEPVEYRHGRRDKRRSAIPEGFTGWVVQPMPFNDDKGKFGERAIFSQYNYGGAPTVVGRINYQQHKYGCVAYTKDPLPVNKAWRITLLKTTKKTGDGLVSLKGGGSY